MASGYTDCKCRDCFEIAISKDGKPAYCWECREAGCEAERECCVERLDEADLQMEA